MKSGIKEDGILFLFTEA
jgi:dynein heavy chain